MSSVSPRAFSYVRFSTPEQLKGDSLRRQLDLSARYAKDHGLVLDEKLTFRDLGVSAFNKSNIGSSGKLREFLDAVDEGHVPPGSFLLVESLDRLSRAQIRDALRVFLSILDKGITIVTLADGMTYAPTSNDANKEFTSLVVSIAIMSRAHEESLTKSRRLKAAWTAKRRKIADKKLTSQCPAWLRLNEKKERYETIPEKVAVVRQIVKMIMSGLGKGSIAKRLNQKGVPTIGLERKRRNVQGDNTVKNPDRSWYESYITKIVKSRALIGEFQPHRVDGGKRVPEGEPVKDYFPRILTDEEFVLLQDLISERGRRSGGNRGRMFSNLFTRLATCGYCGSAMVFVDKGEDKRGNRNNRGNRFLVCHKAKRGAGCHYVPWIYADFEEAFFRYAQHAEFEAFMRKSNDAGAQLRAVHDDIVVEQAKRAELITKRDRLVEALAGSESQPRAVLAKITDIECEIDASTGHMRQLEAEVQALNSRQHISDVAIEALRKVASALETTTGDERFLYRTQLNEHLRRVIERLLLFPGGTIHTSEEVARIKVELSQSGRYAPEDIESYTASELHMSPHRHERYFLIRNRNEVIQILRPDSPVPQIIDVMVRNPGLVSDSLRLWHERLAEAAQSKLETSSSA